MAITLGQGTPTFGNANARTLRIAVDGSVWLKPGAAFAYRGGLTFERLPTIGAASIDEAVLREAAPLVRARGNGLLYCGNRGAHVRVARLAGETLIVSCQGLLAFESTLEFEASLAAHGVGVAAGGLVVVRLSGHGSVALLTHVEPLTLLVSPGEALSTDPHATLAWSADLDPVLKTDMSWRSAIGHGGREPSEIQATEGSNPTHGAQGRTPSQRVIAPRGATIFIHAEGRDAGIRVTIQPSGAATRPHRRHGRIAGVHQVERRSLRSQRLFSILRGRLAAGSIFQMPFR